MKQEKYYIISNSPVVSALNRIPSDMKFLQDTEIRISKIYFKIPKGTQITSKHKKLLNFMLSKEITLKSYRKNDYTYEPRVNIEIKDLKSILKFNQIKNVYNFIHSFFTTVADIQYKTSSDTDYQLILEKIDYPLNNIKLPYSETFIKHIVTDTATNFVMLAPLNLFKIDSKTFICYLEILSFLRKNSIKIDTKILNKCIKIEYLLGIFTKKDIKNLSKADKDNLSDCIYKTIWNLFKSKQLYNIENSKVIYKPKFLKHTENKEIEVIINQKNKGKILDLNMYIMCEISKISNIYADQKEKAEKKYKTTIDINNKKNIWNKTDKNNKKRKKN